MCGSAQEYVSVQEFVRYESLNRRFICQDFPISRSHEAQRLLKSVSPKRQGLGDSVCLGVSDEGALGPRWLWAPLDLCLNSEKLTKLIRPA